MFVGKVLKPIKTDIQTAPGSKLKFISRNVKQNQKMYVAKVYVPVKNIVWRVQR